MNAPEPIFTSSTSDVGALGDLLAHDRAGDQRDRLDGGRDVAQGVELAVGGSEPVAGRGDDRADGPQLGHGSRRWRASPASRGTTPACRACRRCGRAHDRRAGARPRRRRRPAGRAAARSCRRRRRWSACRPSGRPDAGQVEARTPVSIMAWVQVASSPGRHALEEDGHAQRGGLLVGDGASGVAVDEEP